MNKQTIFIAIFLVVVIAIVVAWVTFRGRGDNGVPKGTAQEPPAADAPETLGAEIFDKTRNPIKGEIGGGNPVEGANPLEGVYQNPFGS